MKERILFTVVLITALSVVKAQIDQPVRYELKKSNKENYYSVISAHEFGVILLREGVGRSDHGQQTWEVIMLDTDLKEEWRKTFEYDPRLTFSGYEYRSNHLYLLFRNGTSKDSDLQIEQINLSDGNAQSYFVENEMPIELEQFTMAGQTAVFGGYTHDLPTIFLFDLEEHKSKVLPGFFKKNTFLIDLNVDDASNNFNVVLSERESLNETILTILNFNQKGGQLSEFRLPVENKTSIHSAKTTNLTGNKIIVTGTYGGHNSSLSEGVFFVNLNQKENTEINYYEFASLDNYLNYLPEKRKEKIKEKIDEKKAKGKEHTIRSRVVLHELISERENYIMMAEIYSFKHPGAAPANFFQPYWTNSFNEGPRGFVRRRNAVAVDQPSNYSYTQAIILGFNEEGELLWDNSLEIDDVSTLYLDQVVNISTSDNRAVLLYKHNNELRSKIIEGGTVIEDNLVEKIKLLYEGDKTKSGRENFGGLNYWYENNFFSWGYQWIANKQNPNVAKRRNVFYINKISIK